MKLEIDSQMLIIHLHSLKVCIIKKKEGDRARQVDVIFFVPFFSFILLAHSLVTVCICGASKKQKSSGAIKYDFWFPNSCGLLPLHWGHPPPRTEAVLEIPEAHSQSTLSGVTT